MKDKKIFSLICCLLISLHLLGALVYAAETDVSKNFVSVGASNVVGVDTRGATEYIEYERKLWRLLAVYAVFGNIQYRCDAASYVETGRGPGGEVGVRFYPFKRPALKELYYGVGSGRWSVKGSWKDDVETPFVTSGSLRTSISTFILQTGYKWYFGSQTMFLDPRLLVGLATSSDSAHAFGNGSQIAAVQIAVGITW